MLNKRPKLKLPLTMVEKIFEIVCLVAILGTCFGLVSNYFSLPERIPTHFGASGQADGWGGKGSLFVLPIIILVLYVVLSILERFPHTYNYICEITEENAAFQYLNARTMVAVLKTVIVLTFAYIEWATIKIAEGKASGLGVGSLLVFLIVIFWSLAFFIVRMVKGE